jgi:Plasmid stabilisation system protein.
MKDNYELRFIRLFYDDLREITAYIRDQLNNPTAAYRLNEQVEKAIKKRLSNPEAYEKFYSQRERALPYYRIYVKNYVIYYVVKQDETEKIMEVRRILYAGRNRNKLI